MFGRSKHMHIADATDAEIAAFEDGEIDDLEAFCGATIARGWLFSTGGARKNAPTCDACAEAAGWFWDPDTEEWVSPYEHEEVFE